MKYALGQIPGCLDIAWTVLGHVLGQIWFGFLGCPEAARRVLGSNRGEREALLDAAPAFPRDFCDKQIQGENPCQSDPVGHEFLLAFAYHILPRRTCICLGSWRQHDAALALLTHGTDQSIVENALLKRMEKLSPV